MVHSRDYFEGRAAQCRRLARSIDDRRANEQLTQMAEEFDAKARWASEHEDGVQSRDGPGELTSDRQPAASDNPFPLGNTRS